MILVVCLKLVSGRSIIVVYLTLVSARSNYRCVPQMGFCEIQVPMHHPESKTGGVEGGGGGGGGEGEGGRGGGGGGEGGGQHW